MSERVGVLGGAFDPIHYGHLILASEAKSQLLLDRILFVPTFHSPHPHKTIPTSFEDRCEMVRLAIAGHPDFSCSEVESAETGPSYSVNTVKMLKDQMSSSQLFFIIGSDNLEQLETWHRPDLLVKLATLAVAKRPGYSDAISVFKHDYELIDMIQIEISARDIRRRIAESRSIRFLVPPPVEAHIHQHGLYLKS